MKNRRIINIINFIRGVEPRRPMDLHAPVAWQMQQAKKYALPTTWLLQYDALLDDFYVDLLKQKPANHECGLWLEIPQPLCEACHIPWRGRYPWDWHTDVGFSIGYLPEERERLADEMVRLFREKMGYAPKTIGCWLFDAHILKYLHEKHNIIGACNCKDQWGTDGYTLWGGYWANAYYPSRLNSYMPAQTRTEQINVPIFRMLGSDPIYQYEADPNTDNGQQVITLEPVYVAYGDKPAGGGNPQWVDWFMKNNFSEPVMHISYAQAGQENSFGLESIEFGLNYQYSLLARLRSTGKIEVETLAETSAWYRANFDSTATTSVSVLDDWKSTGRQALWYLNSQGRLSLTRYSDGMLAIRDWQLFSEQLPEEFLASRCTTNTASYEALPLCDGMRWGNARIVFQLNGNLLTGSWAQPEPDGDSAICYKTDDGQLTLTMNRDTLIVEHGGSHFSMMLQGDNLPEITYQNGCLCYSAQGMNYGLLLPDSASVNIGKQQLTIVLSQSVNRFQAFVN